MTTQIQSTFYSPRSKVSTQQFQLRSKAPLQIQSMLLLPIITHLLPLRYCCCHAHAAAATTMLVQLLCFCCCPPPKMSLQLATMAQSISTHLFLEMVFFFGNFYDTHSNLRGLDPFLSGSTNINHVFNDYLNNCLRVNPNWLYFQSLKILIIKLTLMYLIEKIKQNFKLTFFLLERTLPNIESIQLSHHQQPQPSTCN